jgi:hypothetical protein
MIDLIKTLVETLTQVIPKIHEMRADRRKREIGAALFTLYVRLNETMIAADDIIDSLEVYAKRMHRHLDYGDDAYALTGGKWIAGKVRNQLTNFERLGALLHNHKVMLQIIDTDSYNKLIPLLDYKFGALTYLSRIMRSGSVQLSINEDDLRRLMDSGDDQSALHRIMIDLEPSWREAELSTTSEWGQETYEKVAAYLQEREPRKQLSEIRAALASLREALVSNFSLSDVLLEVGDRHMERPGWM